MRWWLSFAGAEGFRGAVVVDAPSLMAAIDRADAIGCNPGGEVKGVPFPPGHEEPQYEMDRLYNREELLARGGRPSRSQPHIGEHVCEDCNDHRTKRGKA